jgi:glutathione S-transferase/GST-like protein
MYKLYWAKMTGAIAPQALFEEIGAEYEKIVLDIESDENLSPEFLAINSMGQIPALVLPDGTLMTESAAMVMQICDLHPDAKLAPPAGSSESAQFQRWLLFMASNNYSSELRLCYPERFTTDPAGIEGIKEAARSDMDRYFAILNDALDPGPYLLGQTFSAVDIYLWMLTQWHPDIPQLLEESPRIRQLVELVQARPAVAWVLADHEED